MKKCIKFGIKPMSCPEPKTKFRKILEKFGHVEIHKICSISEIF